MIGWWRRWRDDRAQRKLVNGLLELASRMSPEEVKAVHEEIVERHAAYEVGVEYAKRQFGAGSEEHRQLLYQYYLTGLAMNNEGKFTQGQQMDYMLTREEFDVYMWGNS